MLKIGLTGNIGSGKSLVAQIFSTIGIPIFDADQQAKTVLNEPLILKKVLNVFGNSIFTNDSIDREKLASLVFNNPYLLKQLNDIIHPAVRSKFEEWYKNHLDKAFIIYEAAILFESGYYKNLDLMITVFSSPQLRIQRVINRDKISRKLVQERMQNQWTDIRKNELANFVINNNSELLIPQVEEIYSKLVNS